MPSDRRKKSSKTMMLTIGGGVLFVLLVVGWWQGPLLLAYWRYEPREGDILFQPLPHMPLTNAIEGATHSPWSHCGIVAREDDRWVVYEALGNVNHVPLWDWVSRGRESRFAVYRLNDEYASFVPETLRQVRTFVGRPYDVRYQLDDEKIYCSELVYKAFLAASGEELGKLVPLGSLDWKPYRDVIMHYEGGEPPLDRLMITPRHLSEASQLEYVTGNGPLPISQPLP